MRWVITESYKQKVARRGLWQEEDLLADLSQHLDNIGLWKKSMIGSEKKSKYGRSHPKTTACSCH
jgi:hypothetical protein